MLPTHVDSEARFRTIFDRAAVGICVLDDDAFILDANAAFLALLDYQLDDVLGRHANTFSPPDDAPLVQEAAGALHAGEIDHVSVEQRFIRRDGSVRRAALTLSRLPLADGTFGTLMMAKDVTARRAMEREVAAQKAFLAAVLEHLAEGIVACDAGGTLTLFNRALREIHGLGAEGVSPDEWAAHYALYRADGVTPLPTDEIPLLRAFRGETVTNVPMVVAPHGAAARTLLASGQRFADANGEPLGAVVVMRDVTEQARAEDALRGSEARVRGAIEASLDALYICAAVRGPDGAIRDFVCTDANARAAALVGLPASELAGCGVSLLFPALLPVFRNVLESGTPFEAEVHTADQPIAARWIRLQVVRVGDGIGVTARDISDQKAAEESLRALALVDELTGVHNRRGFLALAEREWSRARREKRGAVLAYIDLNDFKGVNDVHGHAEGDLALRTVADVLRAAFRGADVIGRLGGDEFAVLVVPTGPALRERAEIFEVERRIIERLQYHLAASNAIATATGRAYEIRMSIGTAVVDSVEALEGSEPMSLSTLMGMADERLYEKKRELSTEH